MRARKAGVLRGRRRQVHFAALARVMRRGRANFQTVPVPDGAFAAETGHLEILRQFQAISWAGVFAQTAEHAARSVIRKCSQNFAPCGVVPQPSHHNQIFRACQRAQIAGNAKRFAGFGIDVQSRRPAIPLGHHRPLLRILLGGNVLRSLVTERDPHALEQVHQEDASQQFSHFTNCDFPSHRCQ
jgi:hypothetical protein